MQGWNVRVSTQTIREYAAVGLHYLEKGNGYAFQYSCLENPMNIGACQPTVHKVAKSQTQLSDFIFFHYVLKFISLIPFFNLIIYIFY